MIAFFAISFPEPFAHNGRAIFLTKKNVRQIARRRVDFVINWSLTKVLNLALGNLPCRFFQFFVIIKKKQRTIETTMKGK